MIKYGLIYGEPIVLNDESEADPKAFEQRLGQTFRDLHAELKAAMGK